MNELDEVNEEIDDVAEEIARHMPAVELGEGAKNFLHTPLGRYLIGRARNDIVNNRALIEEGDLDDPEDRKRLKKAMTGIAVARGFLIWLQEALQAGDTAWLTVEPLINQDDAGE